MRRKHNKIIEDILFSESYRDMTTNEMVGIAEDEFRTFDNDELKIAFLEKAFEKLEPSERSCSSYQCAKVLVESGSFEGGGFDEIVEEFREFEVGDVAQLKRGVFKKIPGTALLKTNHMFVIVDNENVCEISFKNSKAIEKFPFNIPINNWKAANLHRPSHVKTDTYGKVSDFDIFRKIGYLTDFDLKRVLDSYIDSPQNTILEELSN